MHVRLTTDRAGQGRLERAGDVVDVSPAEAARLFAAGQAERLDTSPAPETGDAPPAEGDREDTPPVEGEAGSAVSDSGGEAAAVEPQTEKAVKKPPKPRKKGRRNK